MIKKLLLFILLEITTSLNLSAQSVNFINKSKKILVMWQPHSEGSFSQDKFEESDGVRYTLESSKFLQLNAQSPLLVKKGRIWHSINIFGYDQIEACSFQESILIYGLTNKKSLNPALLLSINF